MSKIHSLKRPVRTTEATTTKIKKVILLVSTLTLWRCAAKIHLCLLF